MEINQIKIKINKITNFNNSKKIIKVYLHLIKKIKVN